MGPDAKVLTRVARRGWDWRPEHVSISLNHHEGSDWILLREIAEAAVVTACGDRPVPTLELKGAGMFVSGGPNGDNGLSGKKLVVDAYGPPCPSAAVAESGALEARVTLEYLPGCNSPVRVGVLLDGRTAKLVGLTATDAIARDNLSAWQRYARAPAPLAELARWGHWPGGMPWENTSPANRQRI